MSNALDHDTYMVIFKNRTGDVWCNETFFPGYDRGDFVADVCGGAYDTADIERIVRMNITAGVVADVTAEIAQAVADFSIEHECEPCKEARDLCRRFGIEHYDEAATDADSRAYRRELQRDYRSSVGF